MNGLDKMIKANLLMIKNELIVYLALSAICEIFVVSTLMIVLFVPLIYIVMLLVIQYRIYKKLFYTSVFGEGAYLYNAFPVSAEEMVQSKVITVGLIQLIEVAVTVAMIGLAGFVGPLKGLSYMFSDAFETGIYKMGWQFFPVYYFNQNIVALGQALMIFYLIIMYNSGTKRKGKKNLFLLGICMFAGLMNVTVFQFDDFLADVFGITQSVIIQLINLFIGIVLVVLFYHLSVNRFKKKYELK